MPTVCPGVHPVSDAGYTKEGHLYKARVDYPPEATDAILNLVLESRPDRGATGDNFLVLDLGAGTGKLTR